LVHPVTINSNTSEQNVSRAENMNSQGTAKIPPLAKTINSNTETHARLGQNVGGQRKSDGGRDLSFERTQPLLNC